jgi:hypothetical protein
MAKVTFELEDEQVDAIVIQELKWAIIRFEEDLEMRSEGQGLAVFDNDPVKDVAYIQEYISAFKLVLDWYGGSDA